MKLGLGENPSKSPPQSASSLTSSFNGSVICLRGSLIDDSEKLSRKLELES